MIRNIKGNNLLRKYQNGDVVTTDWIDKIIDYELNHGHSSGAGLPLNVAFNTNVTGIDFTGDPNKDRQKVRTWIEGIAAKYIAYPLPLRKRMVDFEINSEDPRAALMEAAGLLTPTQKGQLYPEGSLSLPMVNNRWEVAEDDVLSKMTEPGFIEKFDAARHRSYIKTTGADISYPATWGPRTDMFNEDFNYDNWEPGQYYIYDKDKEIFNKSTQAIPPNKKQATTNLPDDEVLNDDFSNPPENTILDTPATPPNDNYGADKQTVYYDDLTDKYHIIEDDIKWEVDETGEKINDTNKVLSTQEKNKFLTNIFVLDGPGDEPVDQRSIKQPTPLRTVGNVLEKGIEKIDKALRDKNPYRDDTYGPIKDKNKELREKRKAARQENQAARRTGREMKKKFNILEDTKRIGQNRLKQKARAEKRAKKESDQLEFQEKVGDEKADKAVANIGKKDKVQSKRREGKTERKFEVAELNKRIAQAEELLKPEEIENKQRKITIKKKNRLTQRENRKNRQITNRVKRLKEEKEKLEQKEINATPLFGDMDRLEEALEEKRYGGRLKYRTGGNLIKYQDENSTIIDPKIFVSNLDDFSDQVRKGGYSTLDGIAHDPSGRSGRFINETFKTEAEELEDAINYNKQYSAYDPYSLMRPSHKISNAANQAMTAYNLSLASQAPEKTPIFMTDYTPLRQYAPVDFKPATDQYNIGRRAIANNARGTGTLMGNLQQLNSNILNKKIDIAKRAADSQLGFDRTYETAKERIAKEFKDQKMNQYYKDLEHEGTKQNAMTEAVSKWNQQQQTKAGYIQAENSDVNKINSYVNQLSADYNVRLDENGMAYVVHNKTGKKDDRETRKLNQLRRRNLTEQRGQALELMKNATTDDDKIKYREEIKSLDEQLKKVGFYSGSKFIENIGPDALSTQRKTEIKKRGGNIKSKKTTNVLMDGGYTPRNKRQKKLRTKLY